MTRPTAFLAVLAALGGCAGIDAGARFYSYFASALFTAGTLGYVQSQGPVPVVVHGTPFPSAAQDVFARSVAATMSGANAGPPLRFTVDPPGPREADYRAVVVFGTAWVGAEDLCRVRAPEIAPTTAARIHAEAAFCVADRKVTEIKGDMFAAATGPDDPAFHAFVRGLTFNLLPPRTRNDSNRQQCNPMMGC